MQAIEQIPADSQVVLCAGAPDTPEIEKEVRGLVEGLSARRSGIIWVEEMLPHDQLVNILSAAHVFVTPSIYEPMGIVNLEAAAMELPVVGTATGGIPDCIAEGETGYLVPIEQLSDGSGTPRIQINSIGIWPSGLPHCWKIPSWPRKWVKRDANG